MPEIYYNNRSNFDVCYKKGLVSKISGFACSNLMDPNPVIFRFRFKDFLYTIKDVWYKKKFQHL